jgi:glycosyltransferase involved in cell wall biosynthesis
MAEKKALVLYITFIDFGDFASGSSVRPQMMYEALQEAGCEVKLLQTQHNRRSDRRAAVKEISEWLDTATPDFCYIESPSGPIFNHCDLSLMKKIHKKGIKIGYFYRDAYFKFANLFGQQGNKTLREKVIAWMSERDLRFFKKVVDQMYFPTELKASYFDFDHAKPLPPACMGHLGDKRIQKNEHRSIYVGAVSQTYGTDTMLQAFDLLNSNGEEYPLTLICREKEAQYIGENYREKPWLSVVHASGKEQLKNYYEKANIGLRPVEKNAYNDFAFSVKLPEYMEFGLPVLTTNTTESQKFVEKYKIGLVCEDTPEDFADKVRSLLLDQETYSTFCRNVYEAVDNGNTWLDRAKTVRDDLTK